MDARLTPLYEIFKLNTRNFLNCLDGMDDDQAGWRANQDSNGAAAITLHLVDSRHFLARTIGLALEHPMAAIAKEVKANRDLKSLPALGELRDAWKAATGEVRARFGTLTDADLRADTGTRFPVDDKSVIGVIAFAMMHESYHIGQLGLLRRQVGLPAMALG